MRIKTLDTHRKARKIELEQIWREGPFAIFKEVGKDRNYEVIRIHTRQPREAWGETQDWDLIEVYPKAESWGTDGFTLPTLSAAREKVKELKSKPT